MLQELTGIPVVGTVPMMPLMLDDEDSLTDRFGKRSTVGIVDLAVIRLPRISNFSDFSVFDMLPDVSVRYISSPDQLGDPDMILLPGSKDTLGDLAWLWESGVAGAILQKAAQGTVIFGLCGGFQILGRTISDPEGVERQGTSEGLGLLPHHTVYAADKQLTRSEGVLPELTGPLASLSGKTYSGYEIHMGVSAVEEDGIRTPLSQSVLQAGNVYGSYIHGLFDAPGIAAEIVRSLASRKGRTLDRLPEEDYFTFKEKQYDLLADTMRRSLDMEQIYRILEEGI
ncbi:MAG: cobyric acid synthase CobQ, partial [Eubacterium sp.]|nr:cobyric acid synthase CobQ [Eubacterium sp.]